MGQTKLTTGWTAQGQSSPCGAAANVKLAYSVKDFCDETSIGKTKFYGLVKAGKIRLTKIGSRSIVTGTEAARFLEEGG
jgi:hypothetical protein